MVRQGEIVYGVITSIVSYGAFVQVDGYVGLIHISEFSNRYVHNIRDYVSEGQHVKLKVLSVDEEMKQLRLSYKALHKNRGVKSDVPKYLIGFATLEKALPEFIAKQIKK